MAMGNTTIQSLVIDIPFLDNISIEIAWTGTPTGTFKVVGSVSGQNFIPQPISIAPAAGSAGSTMVTFQNQGYQYVALQYIGASSTGILNAWCGGKEI